MSDMMRLYTINEFAERIGVSKVTLRRWDANDILKPAMITPGGQRRYTEGQAVKYEEECKARVDGD